MLPWPNLDSSGHSGTDWSEEAIDEFERLTSAAQWRKLLARIVRFESRPPAPTSTDLIPTSRPALDLVDANSSQVTNSDHDFWGQKCALEVLELHLYHVGSTKKSPNKKCPKLNNRSKSGPETSPRRSWSTQPWTKWFGLVKLEGLIGLFYSRTF